ncbi:hypothetical protein DP939_27590 [Spongiactinospora rosea]|uniref:Uncharacterized protein n=1 Tax=Spongiactinospora rosea TaxID=2248750 RepID=A0A366LSC6_9ACTN|nr:hypothetical protein DP939_27590 [Spongiactinospora rosea]
MTMAAMAALLSGGLASAGVAAAAPAGAIHQAAVTADEWDGPIDLWTTYPLEKGQEICRTVGQIGMSIGSWRAYQCRDDGAFTTYLYVMR